MDIHEVEAAARKLSPRERRLLAVRLLASVDPADLEVPADDPIYNFGKNPVSGGSLEGVSYVDRVLYGREPIENATPGEDDSLWALGSDPVDCGVTDGSINHDRYFCGDDEDDRATDDPPDVSANPTQD